MVRDSTRLAAITDLSRLHGRTRGYQPCGQRAISQQPKQTSLTSPDSDSTWNPFAEEHAAASFTHSSYKLKDQPTDQRRQKGHFLTLSPLHPLR